MTSDIVIKGTDLQASKDKIDLIKGLSFEVLRGEIFGIASVQKAPVRALILMLGGFMKPEKGELKFAGITTAESGRKDGKISVHLSDVSFPPKMTVEEILRFSGLLRGSNPMAIRERVDELVSLLDLKSMLRTKWDSLDSSTKGKIAIVASLIGDPDYIIMDYFPPFEGDFELLVKNYLVSLAGIGKTIVAATEQPEGFCDRVLVLRGPSSFEIGMPDVLKSRDLGYGRIEIIVSGVSLSKVEDALMRANCSWHYIAEDRLLVIAPGSPSETDYVLSELINNGGKIEEVKTSSPTFKDLLRLRTEGQ